MEKGNIANCLVLHFEEYNFENWFNDSVKFLNSLKLEPTHIGVQTIGKSNKITKYQTGYKKLLSSGFENITSIGLYVCNEEEQSPGFNWIANINVYYNRFIGFICFWGIEKKKISLQDISLKVFNMYNSTDFETLLYGYSYDYLHNRYPYFYAVGMSSQKNSIEEKESLSKWLSSMKEIKDGRVRSIYNINFFRDITLSIKTESGLSLKEYILNTKGSLNEIKKGIYLYNASENNIEDIKKEFGKKLILT